MRPDGGHRALCLVPSFLKRKWWRSFVWRIRQSERLPSGAGGRDHLPGQETEGTQGWSLRREGALEEEMATHSRILAWKLPGTKEPGGLQFMGSQRVGYNSVHTCTCAHTHTHTRQSEGIESRELQENSSCISYSSGIIFFSLNASLPQRTECFFFNIMIILKGKQ